MDLKILMAELIGTAILILLGDGVVAGVVLRKSKSNAGGWIVVTAGWAVGVMAGIFAAARVSGAHLNPAVTLALWWLGDPKVPWTAVPTYWVGQFAGAFLGAVLVYLAYLAHWSETQDQDGKLAIFCTGPAVSKPVANFVTEFIATVVLVFGILSIAGHTASLVPVAGASLSAAIGTGFSPLYVALLVFGIGLSLGGPTGYAINPARDLAPRLAHAVLPIPGKGGSNWGYAWIPVAAPMAGAVVAALLYQALRPLGF